MSNLKQLRASMSSSTFKLISEGFMPLSEIRRCTLVGGTALAIHYQHRLSEDLDFCIKNSTLEQDRKCIDKMMDKLEQKGFYVVKLQENYTQIDFEISGVKVSFFASILNILQNDSFSFENLSIAGVETMKAMKMNAILNNYSTLSRDFFDIATIMKQEQLTIFDLLDSYKQHYTKRLSSSFILERLTQKKYEEDVHSLNSIKPKSSINLPKFRQELSNQIKQQIQKDTKIIYDIISNPSIIKSHLNRKFGLSRMNLPQKLATINEDKLVLKALEMGNFDITYKDISGNVLLDYYLDNDIMFAKILSFAKEIPHSWLQNRTFKLHNKIHLIALENSIISCAKNIHNSKEKIERRYIRKDNKYK